MFGTIICNENGLTEEEISRYRSVYCGLCRALRNRFGQVERLALNYDMTFLALLLNGLYEENNDSKTIRCSVHPFKKQEVFQNKYISYAADMTILLAYYKGLDDWNDEKKKSGWVCKSFLERDVKWIEEKYPRQSDCVKKSLLKLSEIEKSVVSLPDEAVNCSGMMLSEIFVYQEDCWKTSLGKTGYELGRFIYLMDAAMDYERDRKKGTYNPLVRMGQKPDEIEDILNSAIGEAAMQFEKLPIIQDVNIMRNILYNGVWQNYNRKVKRKDENHGK